MTYIDDIFKRYLNNSCTEEELSILLRYFELDEYSDDLESLVEQELLHIEQEQTLSKPLLEMVEQNRSALMEKIQTRSKKDKIKKLLIGVSIAASVLLISTWTFYYFGRQPIEQVELADQHNIEIGPGGNRATLTLENGQSIVLNENKTGIAIGENGFAYTDGSKITQNTTTQYATLSTPRKGQYQIVLPDGTNVWLNAESSIRYPTAFTGNERVVELKGEAYFEVTHKPQQPFIVKTDSQHLKVLGTTFNVHDYPDELHTVTTLISGSVELNSMKSHALQILKPEQQAVLGQKGYEISTVDVAPYVAWKDGEFRFKATPLPEAIRQIERWYDLDVDYTHIPDDIKVHASIQRDKNLSSVLYALEEISNVKFKIKGRRLQLMK